MSRLHGAFIVAFTAAATASACGVQAPADSASRLATIESDLATAKADLATTRNELQSLRADFALAEFNDEFKAMAILRPGDSGYSVLPFDLGVVTVQLSDVQPYANGSKVALKFGNPLSSAVQGLSAKVDWGPTDKSGSPINENAQSKQVELKELLRPGTWTTTHLILEGVPPSDLGFVRVSNVTHRGIELIR